MTSFFILKERETGINPHSKGNSREYHLQD